MRSPEAPNLKNRSKYIGHQREQLAEQHLGLYLHVFAGPARTDWVRERSPVPDDSFDLLQLDELHDPSQIDNVLLVAVRPVPDVRDQLKSIVGNSVDDGWHLSQERLGRSPVAIVGHPRPWPIHHPYSSIKTHIAI